MATTQIPLTNVGTSYTIVTQVIPSSTSQTTDHQNSIQTLSPLGRFLKGEPKALGTVQIMIGLVMILFGIVLAVSPQSISVFSGVVFWAALFHISAGCLAISANNKLNSCTVKAALVMNILSTIAAGISIIIMSIDLVLVNIGRYCYYDYSDYRCNGVLQSRNRGIVGVLLVFSLLQFCISIAVSAFTCKATCTSEPTLNIINVVPNPERCPPVVGSIPSPLNTQPGVNMIHPVAMGGPPDDNPPAYCEKSRPDC